MVFQRYIDVNDTRAKNVEIVVNTDTIKAWDPFCTKEERTETLQEEDVPVDMPDGSQALFHISAYIIPKKGEFSSIEAEMAKTEHSHPLGMVVSTHFRCGKGVKRGLKNGALPFNID